jgi:hypothetical protein
MELRQGKITLQTERNTRFFKKTWSLNICQLFLRLANDTDNYKYEEIKEAPIPGSLMIVCMYTIFKAFP